MDKSESVIQTDAPARPRTVGPKPSPEACELAEELRASIARQWPGSKADRGLTESQGASWGRSLDRLLRIDGRPVEQVRFAIDWLEGEQLGRGARFVVQSPNALREKFDRIAAMIQRQIQQGQGPNRTTGIKAMIAEAERQEAAEEAAQLDREKE